MQIMETEQNKLQISDSVSRPLNVTIPESSFPHSKKESGDFISFSPVVGSPGNSPARPSFDSDHITITPSPLPATVTEKPPSSEEILPLVVVSRDALIEPTQDIEKRTVVEEPKTVAVKVDTGDVAVEGEGVGGGGGNRRQRFTPTFSILQRTEGEKMVKKAALGFRLFGFLFCLVSVAVMAVNINQGWALESFYRYKELRYCISVTAIGVLYSGVQAVDLSYNLVTGKYIMNLRPQQLRYYVNFAIDQMIAYLLISATSSAAIRVDDWHSNWGRDRFPAMATVSISVSFLGFLALAISSLISGYVLCTCKTS